MSGEAGLGQDGIPRLGAMLGRYRLDAVIGRGGMGVVFRAVDERLDRIVALKVLAPDLAGDPEVQERFLREARLAAAIEHPHIVPVYEAASVGDVDYIAMRFVPGSDLGRVLRREAPLDVIRTLAIGEHVADALDAAHARGLVHRDVKPANVLLETRGEEWAWLTDFGLTKRIGGSMPPTREGLVGTLEYLSPEAIEHATVDGRSDQYALACVLYHCLSGTPPFAGVSEAQVLRAHLHDEPPRLDLAEAANDLDGVIRRALAKEPADRFASCRDLVAELRRVADDVRAPDQGAPAAVTTSMPSVGEPPTLAMPPSRAPAARRGPALLARRGRALVALVVTGVLIGSIYLASQPGRDTRGLGLLASPMPSATALTVASGGLTGPDGVIVFAGNREEGFDIWAVRPDGTGLVRITDDPAQERSPSVSADGSRIVFTVGTDGKRDIYLMNGDGTGRTRLTRDSADDFAPAISPDGRMVAWTSERSSGPWNGVWLMTDDGDGFDEDRAVEISDQPSAAGNDSSEPAWFPDRRRVAFQSNDAESADIWSVDVSDDSRRHAWTRDLLGDHQPTVGPDGSIVFVRALPRGRFLHRVTADDPVPNLVTDEVRDPRDPDFSPAGDRLVVARTRDLLTMSRTGTDLRRVRIDDMPTATDPDWVASLAIP